MSLNRGDSGRQTAAIWSIAALFVAAVMWVTSEHLEQEQQAEDGRASAEIKRVVQSATQALNRSLLDIDLTLATLGQLLQPERPQDATRASAEAKRLMQALSDGNLTIRTLAILGPDGSLLLAGRENTRRLGLTLPDGFIDQVFGQAVATLSLSAPATSRDSGENVLFLARQITLPGGGRAAAVAEVPVSLIATTMAQAAGTQDLTLTLERDDGMLLAETPSNDTRLGKRLSPPLKVSEADGAPRRLSGRIDGQPHLLATRLTLYTSLLVSASMPEQLIRRRALANHADDWMVSAAYCVFGLLLAALLQWHLKRLAIARAQIEQGSAELAIANDELRRQISARERSDSQRDSTQRLLEGLLQSTHEGFWFVNAEGRTLDVNPAMCRLLGRPREDILGKDIYAFVDDANAAIFRRELVARAQGRTGSYEISLLRSDGSLVECINNATPIHDAQNHRIGSIGMWTEISELKASQRALILARDDANRANRAKSEFLSSMSHELRTPLNAVLGFAQILEYDQNLTAEQQESVREIIRAGQHLLQLISQVLDLAKIESGHIELSMEEVELNSLSEECRVLLQPIVDRSELHLTIEAHTPRIVVADRMRLKQVLLNLLSNAIKYNRPGGSIQITTAAGTPGRVRVTVSDTGIGISPDQIKDLFQPFNRLGAEAGQIEGTGIGLNITRQLVLMMGGEIGVVSTPGNGSNFWVELASAPER